MWQIIDTKTNEVLATYTTRNAAYRAANRRFNDRSIFVVRS